MSAAGKHPQDDDAVEAMAAAWLAQRDDGFSPDKEAEFSLWRQADPRHEAALARLESAWGSLLELRHFRPEATAHPDRNLLAPAPVRLVRFPRLRWAAAAAAVAVVAAGAWWALQARRGANEEVYATTADGFQRVTLSDGSVAELNTASEVRVDYSPAERRVRLVRGEAHFTVAKNKQRPFWVEAGSVTVRAVGTAFDVRLTDAEVDVLVTEGKVALAQSAARPDGEVRRSNLAAGERAVIATGPGARPDLVARVGAEAIREALAWEGPRLVFVSTPLSEAVRQFNERNAVQLQLDDPALGAMPISGSFRPENVDAFVRLLAQGGDVAVAQPVPGRYVLSRAR